MKNNIPPNNKSITPNGIPMIDSIIIIPPIIFNNPIALRAGLQKSAKIFKRIEPAKATTIASKI